MKPLVLTRHARRRMSLYDVSIHELSEVMATPDALEPPVRGRMN